MSDILDYCEQQKGGDPPYHPKRMGLFYKTILDPNTKVLDVDKLGGPWGPGARHDRLPQRVESPWSSRGPCYSVNRSSDHGSASLWYPWVSQKPGRSSAINSRARTHLALFQP